MAKLTKKQQKELAGILATLKRGMEYVYSEHTAVCHVSSFASTTLHYTRKMDDRILYEVEREYGSELCYLKEAAKRLERFIFPPTEEVSR